MKSRNKWKICAAAIAPDAASVGNVGHLYEEGIEGHNMTTILLYIFWR